MSIDIKRINDGFRALDLEMYIRYVQFVGRLSKLYSDNDQPYIGYRFAERLYVKCHPASCVKDLSRSDNSFDAQLLPNNAGVGIKTFVQAKNNNRYKDEKVAEFTKWAAEKHLANLDSEKLIETVISLRNQRVLADVNLLGIDMEQSIYHCLVRKPNAVFIHEEAYPLIQKGKIQPCDAHGNIVDEYPENIGTTIAFSDGINLYKYNRSKNVLYKRFVFSQNNSEEIPIKILDNPFAWMDQLITDKEQMELLYLPAKQADTREFIVLPLYGSQSIKKGRPEIQEKSGLNQWNAGGRARTFGEAYIPIPAVTYRHHPDFLPLGESFCITLPNRKTIKVKVCQENNKALMSDPNTVLMEWLFAIIDGSIDVAKARLNVRAPTLNRPYVYSDLEKIGKDSVAIIKNVDGTFELEVLPLGAYQYYSNITAKDELSYSDLKEALLDPSDE